MESKSFTELSLLEDEAVHVEMRFSFYVGWEWIIKHRDGHDWAVLDSGTAKSAPSALTQASGVLLELAHGWEF